MDLALSDEQEALRESARGFLGRAWSTSRVRGARTPDGAGHDPGLWREMAALGWLGLAFPGAVGGGGGDLLDLAVVFEEAGRALVPTTLHSTVEAALLIDRAADDDQRAVLLPPVLSGDRIVSVALQEAGMRSSPAAIATTASRDAAGDGVVVDGTKLFVPNAGVADALVVVARGPDGVVLVVVPTDSAGVVRTPLQTFAGDAQHMVAFDRVRLPAHRVLAGGWPAVAHVRRDATALQCVEMAGGARAVLDMTVQFVTDRHQFGRPLGSFQAVQHQVADLSMRIDAAWLAAWQAVWRCAGGADAEGAEREVAIAKTAASDAYVDATLTAHQLHGGIGFAVDHDLHLWSDRARWAAATHGTSDEHLCSLGQLSQPRRVS
ncbi:MAG TPA: acyl-CoA dehydrogenase [Acidimicrobiales bacterium]|nr:acyl-CoA dehydrogenase [Acidimicrobiales bacterium]